MRHVLLSALLVASLGAISPAEAQGLTKAQEDLLRAVLKQDTDDGDDDIPLATDPPADAIEKPQPAEKPAKETLPVRTKFSELRPENVPVKVQAVVDPLTFLGSNGTIYRLAGLDVPGLESGGSDFVTQATKRTTELLKDQELKLYVTKDQTTGRTNRMNQSLVQAERRKDNIWIAGQLVADGMARVRTTPSNPEMARDLLALETAARTEKTGLWADPQYAVQTPDSITAKANSFAIVEGRIFGVATRNNETFLNFTNDWRKDFTIGATADVRRQFAKAGINLAALAHKNVRVRGFIEDRNGPFISLDHPAQIEIIGAALPDITSPRTPGMKAMKAMP